MSIEVSRRRAVALLGAASFVLHERASAKKGGPIDEAGFVTIGGIEQWIGIRGADVSNPVILYLHGGPAEAQSPFLEEFRPWQKDFTVVNWDQRGAGKTFGKSGAGTPGMSPPESALERLAEDAREVAAHVCERLSKRKIILVGQSWGAMLGLHVVKRAPQLFSAFVATGLLVSWPLALQAQERWARERAEETGDQSVLKALDEGASLPVTDMKRLAAPRKYVMSPSDLEYLKIQQVFVGSPPFPQEGDVADWIAGGGFSIPKLLPLILSFDARKLGPEIPVPFFVIQGEDDHVVSFEAAREYVIEVRAPKKAFVPIPGGHFACFTHSREFVAALRKLTGRK
jgi:proline iminopeptidase